MNLEEQLKRLEALTRRSTPTRLVYGNERLQLNPAFDPRKSTNGKKTTLPEGAGRSSTDPSDFVVRIPEELPSPGGTWARRWARRNEPVTTKICTWQHKCNGCLPLVADDGRRTRTVILAAEESTANVGNPRRHQKAFYIPPEYDQDNLRSSGY